MSTKAVELLNRFQYSSTVVDFGKGHVLLLMITERSVSRFYLIRLTSRTVSSYSQNSTPVGTRWPKVLR